MESVKYYTGTRSPIDVCKEKNGYSKAWQHHKGRNTHHYEHWTDNYDSGTTYIQMPLKDAMEMICDYFGNGLFANRFVDERYRITCDNGEVMLLGKRKIK
jgi:hypothetical protein